MQLSHDIDALETALKSGVVRFAYMKANGELREARGTRRPDLIPATGQPKGRRTPPPHVLCYWDTDKEEWRSLRRDNLAVVIIAAPL